MERRSSEEKMHLMSRHPWVFLQTGRAVIGRRRARWFDLEKVEEGRYKAAAPRKSSSAHGLNLPSMSADEER